jgi:putative transposase
MNNSNCCHIGAVILFLTLPQIALINLDPESMECPECGSQFEHATRTGVQKNKSGLVQRYTCGVCGYRYNDRNGFGKLKSNPSLIVVAVDLFLRGMSTRDIERHLHDVYGMKIDHTTIFRWTTRYLKILTDVEQKLVSTGKIVVGARWLADEAVINVNGKKAYIWSILDYRTRYLLATLVSNSRGSCAAKSVIKMAVKRFGKVPKKVVTDGLASYIKPVKNLKVRINGKIAKAPIHVAGKTFQHKVNNNRIERFNRTMRRRVRTGDKFEKIDSANKFVSGFGAYYNLLRPNLGLHSRTPAAKARLSAEMSLRQLMRRGIAKRRKC